MTSKNLATLQERLKQAEEAENKLQRLKHLSLEAPQLEAVAAEAATLRAELEKLERADQREQIREREMQRAREALDELVGEQEKVPQALSRAVRMVYDLYGLLKEVDQRRQVALQHLARVDRIDYEVELELAQETARMAGQDPGRLPPALQKKHGEERIREMFNELAPDFNRFLGCNLSNALHRDLADFVLAHLPAGDEQRG